MDGNLPRYYTDRDGNGNWLVCDRHKAKMHGDVIAMFHTRKQAREKMQALNEEDRQDRHIDNGTTTGHGETI